MKKNRILIYSALIAFLGSCDLELESIDESFIPNADTTIVESDEDKTCANELMAAYGYNAFIQNDVIIESGDTEGAIAMGGNLTINGSFTVATQTAGSFFDNDEDLAASLVIDGQVIYEASEGINLNQGYIKIGDLTGSTVFDFDNNNVATNTRITPGDFNDTPRILLQRNQSFESVDASDLIDFEAAFIELNAGSISLSELENNIILEEGNKITLAEDTVNVLNLTGEELNNLTDFTFINQPTIDSPLIINVDQEGEFIWDVQNQAGIGDQHGDFIVYNFYNASEITIQRTTVIGSVLAPSTDIIKKSSDNINGQVIAKSYIHMNGELHEHPYSYCEDIIEEEEEVTPPAEEEEIEEVTPPVEEEEIEEVIPPVEEEEIEEVIPPAEEEEIEEVIPPAEEEEIEEVIPPAEEEEIEVCDFSPELGTNNRGESTTIFVDVPLGSGLSFLWSNDSTRGFITVLSNSTETYTVEVTDPTTNCTANLSISLN